ncbi:bifunctional nicotinamidase/pyrazinamidase [Candidatus Aerophobetes bacterium]|uniref:nicotinamidase n=1 Tax=Aerophobetes bacterium TaxID=2030807 RepID=A0A662DEI3_UNCAE|nr:MAG: bifunctional nicotinamidase/pyrazinamidase [Candidatus Aerophobetes bacterium]
MGAEKALLIIDVQNDFCPGGALAVPEGDKIVPVLNRYIELFLSKGLPIFASRDWHPEKTKHFKDFGGLWPKHCVQKTRGAEFHPGLKLPDKIIILSKGMDPEKDSYSVFQGADSQGKSFLNLLSFMGIIELYVGGLATDYCVKESVLDALKNGFKVKLLMDAIKGVNEESSREAIKQMVARGAEQITFEKLSRIMD